MVVKGKGRFVRKELSHQRSHSLCKKLETFPEKVDLSQKNSPLIPKQGTAIILFLSVCSSCSPGRFATFVKLPARENRLKRCFHNTTAHGWKPVMFPANFALSEDAL